MGRGSNGIGTGSHLYRMFSNDFPQGNTKQPGYVPLSDRIPVQAASDLKRPTSGLRVPHRALECVRVNTTGPLGIRSSVAA